VLAGTAYFGYNGGASGNYTLSGGSLKAASEYLGYSGTGTFTQVGGIHATSSNLVLGYNPGSSGSYSLSGGSMATMGNGGGVLSIGYQAARGPFNRRAEHLRVGLSISALVPVGLGLTHCPPAC